MISVMSYRFETRRIGDGYVTQVTQEVMSSSGLITMQRLLAHIALTVPIIDDEHRSRGGIVLPTTSDRMIVEYGIGAELSITDIRHSPPVEQYTASRPALNEFTDAFKQAMSDLLDQIDEVEIQFHEFSNLTEDEAKTIEAIRRHLVSETAAPVANSPGFYL